MTAAPGASRSAAGRESAGGSGSRRKCAVVGTRTEAKSPMCGYQHCTGARTRTHLPMCGRCRSVGVRDAQSGYVCVPIVGEDKCVIPGRVKEPGRPRLVGLVETEVLVPPTRELRNGFIGQPLCLGC